MNCKTYIELWPYCGDAFLMIEQKKSDASSQWECIVKEKNKDESDEDAIHRILISLFGISGEKSKIKCYGCVKEDVNDVVLAVAFFDERIDVCNKMDGINISWRSVQEIESIHFDESFSPVQFEHYIKYIRGNIWSFYFDKKCEAVKRVVNAKKEMVGPKRGLPQIVETENANWHGAVNRIYDSFKIYGDGLYAIRTELAENVNNSLGTGNPIDTEMFAPVKEAVVSSLASTDYSKYPMPAGGIEERRIICNYLHKEGFTELISPENIIFTASTTQAFNLVLKMIVRPGDVVLFSAPTYGLFVFAPERIGGHSCFVELKEENGWLMDPDDLDRAIKAVNYELKESDKGLYDYVPQVVAYVNINPHNPIGKVMGADKKNLVEKIAKVCRRNDVFIIDDLIYRDIGFNMDNKALPVASFESEFQNSITLMGLSKAYGAAGLRTGMVLADETIIRGIRSYIFQEDDSVSQLTAVALAAAFNDSERRYRAYDSYFSKIIEEYRYRYNIIKAAVDGIDSAEEKYRDRIIKCVRGMLDDQSADNWFRGIDRIHFVSGTEPEAGFFCLVDFSELFNCLSDGWKITDEAELVRYMFHRYRINFITGGSIAWPDKNMLIARFSFSLEPEKLVSVFNYMRKEISELERSEL